MRSKVAIESPYKGDVARNVEFAENVCRWAAKNGYAPYAMHLHNTRFLNDDIPEERLLGISIGLEWTDTADELWICLRPGEIPSDGMKLALDHSLTNLPKRKIRFLNFTQAGELISGWMELKRK